MHARTKPLRVLFLMRATTLDRVFENFLRAVLERGHELEILVDLERRSATLGSGLVFDQLVAEYPDRFRDSVAIPRDDVWLETATRWRLALDWLRYLEPEYAEAESLRGRARARAPRVLRWIVERTPAGRDRARRALVRILRRAEAAVPVPDSIREMIAQRRPDVVLVSPLVALGSNQGDYVRAAQRLGIPVVLMVASWDNLTNKGRLRDLPDATVVWNDVQVEEAVRLHGLPRESVTATGAHAFDHWFAWSPATTHHQLMAKVGLPAGRPMLLYVCSSSFIARHEVGFVRDWLAALRADERLRDVVVIVRPHPQHAQQWEAEDLGEGAVVYPRGGVAPIAAEAKSEYFDSLWHCCAVIGINTSAQVEAAILGRPVFTLADDRFRATQEGTLHFAHLAGNDEAGALMVARSWGEHLDHLAEAVAEPEKHRVRLSRFVTAFVRPYGRDEAAAPRAVAAVEAAAELLPAAASPRLASVLRAITPVLRLRGAPRKIGRSVDAVRQASRSAWRRARVKVGALLGRGS